MTDRAEIHVTLPNLRAAAARTKWENRLAGELRRSSLPSHEREWEFAAEIGRAFRFDFAWPEFKVAVEVQGGGWMPADKDGRRRGAHGGGEALERDCEKHALAAALGWIVVPVTPAQIRDGRAVLWIGLVLRAAALGVMARDCETWLAGMRRAFAIKGSPAAWGVTPAALASTSAPVKARVRG